MQLTKSCLQAIILGLAVSGTMISCEKEVLEPNDAFQVTIKIKSDIEFDDENPYDCCPACGMG